MTHNDLIESADRVVSGEDMPDLCNSTLAERLGLREETHNPPYTAAEIMCALFRADPQLDVMLGKYRAWTVGQAADMIRQKKPHG